MKKLRGSGLELEAFKTSKLSALSSKLAPTSKIIAFPQSSKAFSTTHSILSFLISD